MATCSTALGCFLALLAYAGPAAAQTVVEYGATGSAAATATSTAKGVGDGIGGMFGNLNQTLNPASPAPANSSRSVSASPAKPTKPPAPRPNYEDAIGIEKGMSCEEVTRRFGPPAMSFAGEEAATMMSYASKAGGVQVTCQDGKVASVEKPATDLAIAK